MSFSHEVCNSTNITDPSTDPHLLVFSSFDMTERPPTACLRCEISGMGYTEDRQCLDLYKDFSDSVMKKLERWAKSDQAHPVWEELEIWDKLDDTKKADTIIEITKFSAQCISEAQQEERFRNCGTHVCGTQINRDCPFLKRDDCSFIRAVEFRRPDSLVDRAWHIIASLWG